VVLAAAPGAERGGGVVTASRSDTSALGGFVGDPTGFVKIRPASFIVAPDLATREPFAFLVRAVDDDEILTNC
jgi:hypothetical protein